MHARAMRCALVLILALLFAPPARADIPRYIGHGGLSLGIMQPPRPPQYGGPAAAYTGFATPGSGVSGFGGTGLDSAGTAATGFVANGAAAAAPGFGASGFVPGGVQPGHGMPTSLAPPPTSFPMAPPGFGAARLAPPGPVVAGNPANAAVASPGLQCRQAVQAAGRAAGIPDHLMSAIARVESGQPNGDGTVDPWPWSINVEGIDHIYKSKPEVIAAVQAFQARGSRSIDVGCMQVNLMYHPEAFPSLDQAFDPVANATYAAAFLQRLFAQTGSWPSATAAYHSAVPELGQPYQRKVQSVLAEEQRRDETATVAPRMMAMNNAPAPMGSSVMSGMGAIMLNHRGQAARLLPMVPGTPQRGLDAYRAAPVPIAGRFAARPVM